MKFTVEKSIDIINNDLKTLRNLYMPIIGPISVSLYELLLDYSELNNQIITYFPMKDVESTLGVSSDEVNIARKKLEAVGLVRTYEKADNYHFIFTINKPLSPSQLRSNSILFNMITKKISVETFERFEYSSRTTKYEKSEFKETTLKFQDIFAFENHVPEIQTTHELPSKTPDSIEDAIAGLNPPQFVAYLTNKRVQRSMISMLNDLTNSAFSSRTINLIIKYSYDVNGKVVKNHVRTIALDLLNKDAITYTMVKEELTTAMEYKSSVFVEEKQKEAKQKGQININEIYGQIGDL